MIEHFCRKNGMLFVIHLRILRLDDRADGLMDVLVRGLRIFTPLLRLRRIDVERNIIKPGKYLLDKRLMERHKDLIGVKADAGLAVIPCDYRALSPVVREPNCWTIRPVKDGEVSGFGQRLLPNPIPRPLSDLLVRFFDDGL